MDNNKFRVCHITSAHSNEDVRIFHKECVSLANAGYQVFLVAPGDSFQEEGVNIVGLGAKPASRLQRMTQYAKAAYKTAVQTDAHIYHIHDPELLPYALRLFKSGAKVIYDSHENYREQILQKEYLPKVMRRVIASLFFRYETYVLKYIDAAIVPCRFSGKNIFEGRAKRTVYLDNVPKDIFAKAPLHSKSRFESNKVCYVGGLSHSRGITHLMRACCKANAQLILAGSFTPADYHGQLKQMVEYRHVDYRGQLNHEQVSDIYSEAAIGMCTILNIGQYNTGDNLATKVYEYMSSGLPVIITNSARARQLMSEHQFGITVEPDGIDDIALAIRYLLDNPDVAEEMGSNGRRAVLEELNWNVEERKLLILYEELLT